MLRRILIPAMLGISTTIAVAWVLSLSVGVEPEGRGHSVVLGSEHYADERGYARLSYTIDQDVGWPFGVPSDWPAPWYVSSDRGLAWQFSVALSGPPTEPTAGGATTLWGFPFLALRSDRASSREGHVISGVWHRGVLVAGRPLKPGDTSFILGERRLPLKPAWPGFIADAMIWGAAWFGLLTLVRWFRECRRVRKGLCRKCRYDVAHLPRCPECGLEIRGPTTRRS